MIEKEHFDKRLLLDKEDSLIDYKINDLFILSFLLLITLNRPYS